MKQPHPHRRVQKVPTPSSATRKAVWSGVGTANTLLTECTTSHTKTIQHKPVLNVLKVSSFFYVFLVEHVVEPILEGRGRQCGKVFGGGVILEQAALADNLLFSARLVDIVPAEALVLDDDLGEDILGLAGQAESGLQEALAAGVVQFDADLLELFDIGDDAVEQPAQVLAGGGSG